VRERPQIAQLQPIFRGDDEPELVAIAPAASFERLEINQVFVAIVRLWRLAALGGPFPDEVAKVCGNGTRARTSKDNEPGPDHDGTGPGTECRTAKSGTTRPRPNLRPGPRSGVAGPT